MLPQAYQKTENNDQCLLYHSDVADPQRLIIFIIQFLSNPAHWVDNGTFKVCTVHAEQGGAIFTYVFGFFRIKQATYTRFYREIFNNSLIDDDPQDILLDFQKSVMNVINNLRP